MIDLASTKSKFNYMSKINEEMMKIQECQARLRHLEKEEDNPESHSSRSSGFPNIFTTTFTQRMH